VQFWDHKPPSEVAELMETWRVGQCAGQFGYERFDDDSADDFIGRYFDRRTLSAFRQCAVPAMKADFFRYCFLFREGGIYADADTECIASLSDLYRKLERGLLLIRHKNVANDFIIVKRKKEKLLQYAIERAVENIEAKADTNIWQITGPGIMTKLRNSQTREAMDMFAGFELWPVPRIGQYVKFNWKLKYKTTDAHWTNVTSLEKIFRK